MLLVHSQYNPDTDKLRNSLTNRLHEKDRGKHGGPGASTRPFGGYHGAQGILGSDTNAHNEAPLENALSVSVHGFSLMRDGASRLEAWHGLTQQNKARKERSPEP